MSVFNSIIKTIHIMLLSELLFALSVAMENDRVMIPMLEMESCEERAKQAISEGNIEKLKRVLGDQDVALHTLRQLLDHSRDTRLSKWRILENSRRMCGTKFDKVSIAATGVSICSGIASMGLFFSCLATCDQYRIAIGAVTLGFSLANGCVAGVSANKGLKYLKQLTTIADAQPSIQEWIDDLIKDSALSCNTNSASIDENISDTTIDDEATSNNTTASQDSDI